MSPGSEAWFAQQKFPTTVVKFLSVLLTIHRVTFGAILPFHSAGWGSKGLPTDRLELPPHLIQEDPSKVALSGSDDVRLVFPKGKLRKIGPSLRITNSDIDQVNGDAGGITPAAGWKKTTPTLRALEGSC